jgi:type II secretory pathway component GspD/PulD (secretin)
MRRTTILLALPLLFAVWAAANASPARPNPSQQGGISLVETGEKSKDGKPLFTIRAEGAPVGDVLRTVFRKTGEQYRIDESVTGFVDLYLENVTMDRILQEIQQSREVPFKITRDKGITLVTRAPDIRTQADAVGTKMEAQGSRAAPSIVPLNQVPAPLFGMQQQSPLEKSVTINVPDDRRIPFREAIQIMGRQAGVQFNIDPRISDKVMFSGTVTRTQLRLVLDTMSKTFKWVPMGSYILITPQDQMLFYLNDAAVGGSPVQTCPNCHQSVIGAWNFCPNCGWQLPRTGQSQMGNRGLPAQKSGRPGPGGNLNRRP